MSPTPNPAKRDVVVTLRDDAGADVCVWLLSVPSRFTPEEALADCAPGLLDLAIEAGDISEDAGSANFHMREADVALDADLYLQEASESGPLN